MQDGADQQVKRIHDHYIFICGLVYICLDKKSYLFFQIGQSGTQKCDLLIHLRYMQDNVDQLVKRIHGSTIIYFICSSVYICFYEKLYAMINFALSYTWQYKKKRVKKENYLLTQLILRLLPNNFFKKIESKENYLLTQLILKLLIIFLKIL